MARAALGEQQRGRCLLGARLHECVQFPHGIEDDRQIDLRLLVVQAKAKGGGDFDQSGGVGHSEHGSPHSARNCATEPGLSLRPRAALGDISSGQASDVP